jgi:hypothetical protein
MRTLKQRPGLGSGSVISWTESADPGSGAYLTPRSGIRYGKNPDPGSRINIPDPQHCSQC